MIRIEIGAMPPLLRSIVRSALRTEEDLVVMEQGALDRSGAHSTGSLADVIIVCSDRQRDDCIAIGQLAGNASPAIVAIDSSGGSATILRVTAERTLIAGAADLCNTLRLAAAQGSKAVN